MFKFLKGVVAGSGAGIKDFPYTIGEPYSSAWGSWSHYRGINKDDGSPVSIFSISGSNNQDEHLAAGRNGVKRLKTVRHPNILSSLHNTEAELFDGSTSKITIYIVTEPVMPLWEKIKELHLEGTQRNEYFAWGLIQIWKAVSFLNNDCKLVHGHLCVDSVVVTQTLDWKLHALDVSSEFNANSDLSKSPIPYTPPEFWIPDWAEKKKKSLPWSIDSWGFGCLIRELFSGSRLTGVNELLHTDYIPKSLFPDYYWLLSPAPSSRLNPSKFIDDNEYFHNKLVETVQFMETLNLKDSAEKDSFFRKLPNLAEQLPRQIVLKKLLPLLSSALEFGSAPAPALTSLFKMGSWLPAEEFNVKILPTIVKLFASNDRAIRVGLLQHIDQFGESLSAQVVDEQLSRRTISGPLLKYISNLRLSSGDVDNLNGGARLIPGNAGLLGWAMSSLTLKGKPSDHTPIASASANTSLPSATPNASSVMTDTVDIVPMHVNPSINAPDHPQPSSPTSVDGWGELENGNTHEDGDKEEWDDLDPIEERKPTPLSSIQAAQERPIVQSHTPGSGRPKAVSKASKEGEDDLWEPIAVQPPKSTVKFENTKSASSSDDPWGSIAAPPSTSKANLLSLRRARVRIQHQD